MQSEVNGAEAREELLSEWRVDFALFLHRNHADR